MLRLSDTIAGRELRKTAYGKEFLSTWNAGFCSAMIVWEQGAVAGLVNVFRTPEQGDFTEGEMDFLRELRPQFEVALRRVLRLERERSVRVSFESFLQHLPLPTVMLTWELAPIYRNPAGLEACLQWEHGPERARQFKAGKDTEIPAELLDACQAIKRNLNLFEPHNFWPCFMRPQTLCSRRGDGLEAQIALVQFSTLPLQRPVFVIQFSGGELSRNSEGNGDPKEADAHRLQQLSRLTASERELAMHVCQGLSNDEIATRLSKSVLTVKTQLQSIYRKLGLPSRTRLMALLAA